MNELANEIQIQTPDDMHLHIRDGERMRSIVGYTARQFKRAVIMPNLKPPITTVSLAKSYKERIREATEQHAFEPLMTLYMTETMPVSEVEYAKREGIIGVKLYPSGATTNADAGVRDFKKITGILHAMEANDLPLLVHGETVEDDIFEREKLFIERFLVPTVEKFPNLRIVFEHITTQSAVEWVMAQSEKIAATITPQHLLFNRTHLFQGGLRPHNYCLPVLKTELDRQALLGAIRSGSPKFFGGTDSAPHAKHEKESACCYAGCFTAVNAIELYAEAFEEADCLKNLSPFLGQFGADFYGLPHNEGKVKLQRRESLIQRELAFGDSTIVPFRAGETLRWSFLGQ